jgi:predicted nucleotidyltransferase
MAKKTNLNKKQLKEIRHYEKKLISAGIPVDKIILFGSSAKGTTGKWSDLDLCVVSKIFGHNRFYERLKLIKLLDNESINIEPHPFDTNSLNDKWDPLAYEIRKYGISL